MCAQPTIPLFLKTNPNGSAHQVLTMGRTSVYWSHSKTVALIWIISLAFFWSLFQFALHNTPPNYLPHYPSSSSEFFTNMERRSRLYDKMARELDESGLKFLKHGETSQSLLLSDLFNMKDGFVTPVLKAANPPVRANILYLKTEYSIPISEAVKHIFNPYFDKAIWFQNSSLYHFSLFHASHHISPVPATDEEIEAEATAVEDVAKGLCRLEIVLDRVLLTSTGVLLGCWQVNSGSDPVTIRTRLRIALPNAPEKQLYDAAILHTSLARLLGHPRVSPTESLNNSDQLQFFHDLVARLNNKIHGFKAKISDMWYVEEHDVFALALDGKMKVRKFKLRCSRNLGSKDKK